MPLAGTPSPRAPDARRRGGRGRAPAARWPRRRRAGCRRCARRSPASSSGRPGRTVDPGDARSSSRTAPCTRSGSASARSSGRGTRSSSRRRASSSRARSGRPARVPVYVRRQSPHDGWRWDAEAHRARGRAADARAPPLQPRQPDRLRPHAGGGRCRRRGRGPARAPRRHRRGLRGRALGRRPAHLRLRRSPTNVLAGPQPRQEPLLAAAPCLESFPAPRDRSSRAPATLEWDCLRVDLAAQTAALAVLEGPRDWLDAVHAGLVADRAVALAAVAATPGLSARRPGRGAVPLRPRRLGRAPVGAGLARAGPPGRRRHPLPGARLRTAPLRGGGARRPMRSRPRSPAGPTTVAVA